MHAAADRLLSNPAAARLPLSICQMESDGCIRAPQPRQGVMAEQMPRMPFLMPDGSHFKLSDRVEQRGRRGRRVSRRVPRDELHRKLASVNDPELATAAKLGRSRQLKWLQATILRELAGALLSGSASGRERGATSARAHPRRVCPPVCTVAGFRP